ncbi:hypothetical protein ACFQ3S_17390 [Mucilaginibacter terrae]|uniref:hypothetical protein n=1 Tax=Mucilaginibacter terrae TaxID=1955052 RepID=UPI0036273332
MKRNLYYHQVYRRQNKLKLFIIHFFLGISSLPRLLIEVFTRTRFGERYYSFAAVVTISVILFFMPFLSSQLSLLNPYSYHNYDDDGFFTTIAKNITWYIYLAAFFYFSLKRKKEVDRLLSVFDFARFSLSTGVIHPKLLEFNIGKKTGDHRFASTVIEPGIFLIAGILLVLAHQMLGKLFIFVSIVYSLSWVGAYHLGDEFVMDTIDEMICNEEMVESFVEGKPIEDTRGFEMHCRKPNDPSFRRQVVDQMVGDDEASEAF